MLARRQVSDEDAKRIVRLLKDGVTEAQLATRFQRSKSTIAYIRKKWERRLAEERNDPSARL
jgi:transposase